MTDQDETQRIEPAEPTRVIGAEPTARLDPPSAPPQRSAGYPDAPPAPTGIPQPPVAPASQPWTPQPLGPSVPGQPPTAWAAQQPPWPAAYPPPPPGYPSGYGMPAQPVTGASYASSGYPPPAYPPAGYAPPGQQSPGYAPPGHPAHYGQYPQPPYGGSGPYARYADPARGGSAPPPPYNPYGQYYAGQQWPAPAAAPSKPRRTGRTVLVVALAIALAITGFAWALRPMLERSLNPAAPSVEPAQPAQPEQPGTEPGPDPSSNPGGSAGETAGVVFVEGESSGGIAAGTGMVLTPDGKVLTNYHVVAGTQWLQVTVADTEETYGATVLGFDQSKDVALLQLEDASLLATVTIDHDEVEVGDPVAAVGNAGGKSELVRAAGEVVQLDRSLTVNSDSPWGSQEDLNGVIETTAGAVPGHSGGPMFDAEAEVLGITTAGSSKGGRSYAVPIADALEVVATIEAGKDAGTVRVGPAGYMGIVIGDASRHGVTITDVVPGSPADEVGMEVGSTLVRIGDTAVSDTTNLATVIRALEPGDEVVVEWLTPRGEERRASIVLTASPVN